MINTSRYDIDNQQLVGRLLPWWLRGRRANLLLYALSYPLKSVHEAWQAWALERLIEIKTTSQPKSLSWYLDHKLKEHFGNADDHFSIDPNGTGQRCYIFSILEKKLAYEYTRPTRFLKTGRKYTISLYNRDEENKTYADSELYSFNLQESGSVLPMFRYAATEEDDNEGTIFTYSMDESQIEANSIVIYAPAITEDGGYTEHDYKAEVLAYVTKYMTNKQNIVIICNERIID